MKYFFFLSIILISFNSCESEPSLQKVGDDELIKLYEGFNIPDVDSILVKGMNGQLISTDSLKLMSKIDDYVLDYYKDDSGMIKEGRMRKKTSGDDALMDRIFKVEMTEEEVKEINQLKTSTQKEEYLMALWDEDQANRIPGTSDVAIKFGWNSREHKDAQSKFVFNDKRIFNKMRQFLQVHGYPEETNTFHWKAHNAFPTVIGHNHNFSEQRELLPFIIEAYEKGDCPLESVIWILGEMHEAVYGHGIKMEDNVYTDEDLFKALSEALNTNAN